MASQGSQSGVGDARSKTVVNQLKFVYIEERQREVAVSLVGLFFGDFKKPFELVAGLFYFDEDIDYRNGLDFGAAFSGYVDILTGGAGTVLGLEALLGYAPGTFHNGVAVREYAKQTNQSSSIFG